MVICRQGRVAGAAQLMALLETTRPLSSMVAGTLSATAVIRAHGNLTRPAVAAGLAMSFVTAFGFVLNDIFDYRKDVAAGERRPLATGRLSKRSAACLAVALLMIVFLLSLTVGSG